MTTPLTRQAIRHTLHCLLGCGIGEILGSAIGAAFEWHNMAQTALAVLLAFLFGYAFTYIGIRRTGIEKRQAIAIALSTDTVSITTMEVVDNGMLWMLPGAMDASVLSWLFWQSMAIALAVAFVATVPINRFMLARNKHVHHHH